MESLDRNLLARYRVVCKLARGKRVLNLRTRCGLGPAMLAEAGNQVVTEDYEDLKGGGDARGRSESQSGGYDLVLALDGFGSVVSPATVLNTLRERLTDEGVFVVGARLAQSTGRIEGDPAEVAYRFESLAHLLQQYFRVVTHAFQHGAEFQTAWNAYSDQAVFFCWVLKPIALPEAEDWLQTIDAVFGATAQGMVPFSLDYLQAHCSDLGASGRPALAPSRAAGNRVLFYVQPLALYNDPLQYQTFFERSSLLARQYRQLGWQAYVSTTYELKQRYSSDYTFCPEDFRRPPITREWRASYKKTLMSEPDAGDPETAYWIEYVRFLLDRVKPDVIFLWNKNVIVDRVAKERGVLVIHNEVALDRNPRPPSYFFDPFGINAESAMPALWRGYFQTEPLHPACADLVEHYRRTYINADASQFSRIETLAMLGLAPEKKTVLIPLQVENDSNILGNSPFESMAGFCTAVLNQLGEGEFNVIVKPHPADPAPLAIPEAVRLRARVLGEGWAMSTLLRTCDYVFTISSTAGYEALQAGKHVVTFGSSPYSGLGFTVDVPRGESIGNFVSRCEEVKSASAGKLDALSFLASLFYPVSEMTMWTAERQVEMVRRWIRLKHEGADVFAYWNLAAPDSVDWERFAVEKRKEWVDYHAQRLLVGGANCSCSGDAAQARRRLEQALTEERTLFASTEERLKASLQSEREECRKAQQERAALLEAQQQMETALAEERNMIQVQVDRANVRISHLCHEVDMVQSHRQSLDAELRQTLQALEASEHRVLDMQQKVAQLERVGLSGVSKRALHRSLNAIQPWIPEFVRSSVRRYYLKHFYLRIYPEKRPGMPADTPQIGMALRARETSQAAHSGYAPFLAFKKQLCKELPMDFEGLSSHSHAGLVSVVLPVYNGADYLHDAMASVLAQSYPHFELIVVDDGSTDETPDILQRFSSDARVRIIRQDNQKLPAALNAGFSRAVGEFYTWTSADNLMLPDCLEKLVASLRDNPNAEFVYADEEIIDEQGRPCKNSDFCPGYQTPPGSSVIRWPSDPGELNFIQNNYIGGCFLYRAWAAKIVGGYSDRTFGFEDYDYWMRMNALFRVTHARSSAPLYRYRLHGQSLSAHDKQLRITERVRDFMAFDRERRDICLDAFDITFVGSHPWFAELKAIYMRAGNNVFEFDGGANNSPYHYRVTRAHRKSLAVFGSGTSASILSLAFDTISRGACTARVLLLDDQDPRTFPSDVPSAFDWLIATIPNGWEKAQDLMPRSVVLARSAAGIAYPLLALVNRIACDERSTLSTVAGKVS